MSEEPKVIGLDLSNPFATIEQMQAMSDSELEGIGRVLLELHTSVNIVGRACAQLMELRKKKAEATPKPVNLETMKPLSEGN